MPTLRATRTHAAIRVDASPRIGTGHVMRCLTLAQALTEAGWRVCFVSRHMPATFRTMVLNAGHDFIQLATAQVTEQMEGLAYSAWLGAAQSADAQDTVRVLCGRSWDWLVVDHYALDARWESALRPCATRILVIDDIADRSHDCDALLDQNLHPSMDARYDGKVPNGCRLLLGPRYALLRREFAELRKTTHPRSGEIGGLLIAMGGMDENNMTGVAMRAVGQLPQRTFEVDVAIGAEHSDLDELRAACNDHGYRCHVQASNVAALMGNADIAIGGCGVTSWERCCLGVPTIGMALAKNQVSIAQGLAAAGAIVYLGDAAQVGEAELLSALLALIREPQRVAALSAASLALVDGEGTARVRDSMIATS